MIHFDELMKHNAVEACETLDELATVILSLGDLNGEIQGRSRKFNAERMAEKCRNYDLSIHNSLTRMYGIRQQAMMILFYIQNEIP